MSGFVPAAKTSDLHPGQMKRVMVDGRRICLANVDGAFYAIEDRCGHQKVALSRGGLEGHVVECPLHSARFDVRTGTVISGADFGRRRLPGMENLGPEAMEALGRVQEILAEVETEDVPACEVRVEGDSVLVKV